MNFCPQSKADWIAVHWSDFDSEMGECPDCEGEGNVGSECPCCGHRDESDREECAACDGWGYLELGEFGPNQKDDKERELGAIYDRQKTRDEVAFTRWVTGGPMCQSIRNHEEMHRLKIAAAKSEPTAPDER